jgi:VanZ family protein
MPKETPAAAEQTPESDLMTSASLTLTRPASSKLRVALFSQAAQRAWLVSLFIVVGVVTVLACRPADAFHPTLGWDKLNHAAAFMAMAFCAHLALRETPHGLFWVVFPLVALGVGIELVQLQVPGRSGDVEDLVADLVGLVLGLVVAMTLTRSLDRRKKPRPRQKGRPASDRRRV